MNKNVENIRLQIHNTLEQMLKYGYVLHNNIPKIEENNQVTRITWNNHKGGREVSSKYFLRVDQYLKIVSDNAYLAIFNDYSIIRCSFSFMENRIISENLLWWPCPVIVDSNMVDEFGLVETIECLLQENGTKNHILMRSPIRVDFDVKNDGEFHPRSHIHMENEDCRINTSCPICFNRFINYIIKCYYPSWRMDFEKYDYLSFQYEEQHRKIKYYNMTQLNFE